MSDAPERIYGWLNTQLSIARYAGGITFNGYRYVIDLTDHDQPLVRADVLKRERARAHRAAKAEREMLKALQASLYD